MERVEEVLIRWTIAGHVRVRAAGHRLQEIVTTARGTVPILEFRSMNFRIETWSAYE